MELTSLWNSPPEFEKNHTYKSKDKDLYAHLWKHGLHTPYAPFVASKRPKRSKYDSMEYNQAMWAEAVEEDQWNQQCRIKGLFQITRYEDLGCFCEKCKERTRNAMRYEF